MTFGDELERGTGRTTAQMREAPPGAIFVWVNGYLDYPKRLARDLGRRDLHIVSPYAIDQGILRMVSQKPLVIDHAARLSGRQLAEIRGFRL